MYTNEKSLTACCVYRVRLGEADHAESVHYISKVVLRMVMGRPASNN